MTPSSCLPQPCPYLAYLLKISPSPPRLQDIVICNPIGIASVNWLMMLIYLSSTFVSTISILKYWLGLSYELEYGQIKDLHWKKPCLVAYQVYDI
jgi:hypothetical protein